MLVYGSLEAVATTYLSQSMRTSSHKLIRHIAAITPIAIIGVHLIEGAGNLITTPSPESPSPNLYEQGLVPPGVSFKHTAPAKLLPPL